MKPFVTVTHGIRGWFAVLMVWGDECYEPWNSGIDSYKTREGAVIDARSWAEAEGVELQV